MIISLEISALKTPPRLMDLDGAVQKPYFNGWTQAPPALTSNILPEACIYTIS